MKLLKDLIVARKDLKDWYNTISWSRNGTLYLNTTPDIIKGVPIYSRDVGRNSRGLFHLKQTELDVKNKLEFEYSARDVTFNSQPLPALRLVKPAKVDDRDLIAGLTTNGNVIVYLDQELVANLDQPDRDVDSRIYVSLEWSSTDNSLAVGSKLGELIIFSGIIDGGVPTARVIKIDEQACDAWVTHIRWQDNLIIAVLSNNAVYAVSLSGDNVEIRCIKQPDRFKIFDVAIMGQNRYVVITSTGIFYRIDCGSWSVSTLEIGYIDEFYIIPMRDEASVILLSNKTTCRIDVEAADLVVTQDTIIGPHLERKFKRWNSIWNELHKYETTLMIYGVALSPDGYSVAIIYDVERVSFRYVITCERQYNIIFVPLADSWCISNKASGFAWYQTYNIYKVAGREMTDLSTEDAEDNITSDFDTSLIFNVYLERALNTEHLNRLRFKNYIQSDGEKRKEFQGITEFYDIVFKYALGNKETINNPLDIMCVTSLAKALKNDTAVPEGWKLPGSPIVQLKTDLIEQSFDLNETFINEYEILSKEGIRWRRCCVTLLPILTTHVRVCPVTGQRMIDIVKDTFNEYGWFTRTLLEVFRGKSVYSGTRMI